MIRRTVAGILLAAWVAAAPPPAAQEAPAVKPPDTGATALLDLLPAAPSVTRHALRLGDRTLDYTATAGTLPLRDGTGERTAEVFHVAYTAEPADAAPAGDLPVQRRPGRGLGVPDAGRRRAADAWRSATTAASCRRPRGSSTTRTRGSPSPTSCSSTRSAPATAARAWTRRRRGRRFFGVRAGRVRHGGVHPPLPRPGRPDAVARVPRRRELRRLPRGGPEPDAPGGERGRAQRPRPDLPRRWSSRSCAATTAPCCRGPSPCRRWRPCTWSGRAAPTRPATAARGWSEVERCALRDYLVASRPAPASSPDVVAALAAVTGLPPDLVREATAGSRSRASSRSTTAPPGAC